MAALEKYLRRARGTALRVSNIDLGLRLAAAFGSSSVISSRLGDAITLCKCSKVVGCAP